METIARLYPKLKDTETSSVEASTFSAKILLHEMKQNNIKIERIEYIFVLIIKSPQ